jgi:hypothetical protein
VCNNQNGQGIEVTKLVMTFVRHEDFTPKSGPERAPIFCGVGRTVFFGFKDTVRSQFQEGKMV